MSKLQCGTCALLGELLGEDKVDLAKTANGLLTLIVAQLKPRAAAIFLTQGEAQSLVYAAGYGFRTPGFINSPVHRSIISQVVHESKWVHYPDLAKAKYDWARAQPLVAEGFIGYVGIPLITHLNWVGVLELFMRETFNPSNGWLQLAEELAESSTQVLNGAMRIKQWQQTNDDNIKNVDATIEGWTRLLELRDYEPQGHTWRVTEMTLEFARTLGIPERELVHIRRGAMLHDVGKMGVPDSILLKPESLTDDEWVTMRRHPLIAYEFLSPVQVLQPALDIPYCHHENWDGSGYPRGIAGEKIPLAARIFSIVDVWDVLRSDRPYRKAWQAERVLGYIRERGGKNFDPNLAEMFAKLSELWLKNKRTEFSPQAGKGQYHETTFHV